MSWIDVCKIFPSEHSQLVTQRLYAMSKRCLIFDLWKRFWVDVYITSSYGWLLDDLDRRPKNFHCQTILSWSHNVHDRPPTDVIWRFVAHWVGSYLSVISSPLPHFFFCLLSLSFCLTLLLLSHLSYSLSCVELLDKLLILCCLCRHSRDGNLVEQKWMSCSE